MTTTTILTWEKLEGSCYVAAGPDGGEFEATRPAGSGRFTLVFRADPGEKTVLGKGTLKAMKELAQRESDIAVMDAQEEEEDRKIDEAYDRACPCLPEIQLHSDRNGRKEFVYDEATNPGNGWDCPTDETGPGEEPCTAELTEGLADYYTHGEFDGKADRDTVHNLAAGLAQSLVGLIPKEVIPNSVGMMLARLPKGARRAVRKALARIGRTDLAARAAGYRWN